MNLYVNTYLEVLKKYTVFSGRAGRREYWMFILVSIIVSIVLSIVGSAIHFPALGTIYSLAVALPSIGVGIRRLHDRDMSGWWSLIALVPFGIFYLIYVFASPGTPGPNRYGVSPDALPGVATA